MNKGQFRTTSSLRRVACPHLGRVEARHSPFGRPINTHRCFRYHDDGEEISYRHQAQFCLHPDWASCYKLQAPFVSLQELKSTQAPKSNLSTSPELVPAQNKPLSMAAQRMLSHTAGKRTLSSGAKESLIPALPPSAMPARHIERKVVEPTRTPSLPATHPLPASPSAQNNWQVPILWMFVIIPAVLLFLVIGLLAFVALSEAEAVTGQVRTVVLPQDNSATVVAVIEPSATFIPISEVVGAPVPAPIDLATIPTPYVSPERAATDEKAKDIVEKTSEKQQEQEEVPEILPEPWPSEPANGAPDRIRAPRVGIDAPVIPVGSYLQEVNEHMIRFYHVAEYAAGWHDNSSLPGFRGNVVLAGHHNKAGKVFLHAVDLQLGDIIFLDIGHDTYSYIVARKEILPETTVSDVQRNENGRWIAQTEDERLTLVTCYPPDGNSYRVIIVAVPFK